MKRKGGINRIRMKKQKNMNMQHISLLWTMIDEFQNDNNEILHYSQNRFVEKVVEKEENIKKHIEVISLKENKEAVRRFSDFYNRIKLSFYKRIFKKLIRMLN